MSASWNVLEQNARSFTMLNLDETRIRVSPSASVDVVDVLSHLEELGVPPSYCEGVEEIYFTRHLGRRKQKFGDYDGANIRVVAGPDMIRTIVHELGHHVDEECGVTVDGHLTAEREEVCGSGSLVPYNDAEYLAVGFEEYYVGNKVDKRRMRRLNPVLYRTIHNIHRRYQRR